MAGSIYIYAKKALVANIIPISYLLISTILYVVDNQKVYLRIQAGLIVLFAFIELYLIIMNKYWKQKANVNELVSESNNV